MEGEGRDVGRGMDRGMAGKRKRWREGGRDRWRESGWMEGEGGRKGWMEGEGVTVRKFHSSASPDE